MLYEVMHYPIQDPKTLLDTGNKRIYIFIEKRFLTGEIKEFLRNNSTRAVPLSIKYGYEVSKEQYDKCINYLCSK